MADWRDVMDAVSEASDALGNVRLFRDTVKDGGVAEEDAATDVAVAVLLAAEAICLELRVLSKITDFVGGVHER
jgi:hypothetical protein